MALGDLSASPALAPALSPADAALPPAIASKELGREARREELRQALGDGPVGWGPFGFALPAGGWEGAPNTGLEAFLYQKLRHQQRWGQEHALGQLQDYFQHIKGVLGASIFDGERRELDQIRAADIPPAEKNQRLDQYLQNLVPRLRSELLALDPSQRERNQAIYMILARAYKKLQPGQTIFDVLDDAELSRIRKETQADTLWMMDVFEIGEVNRWGVSGGSPYAIRSYHVKKEHGGDEAFKKFVQKAHRLGFKVMVDYIPNHGSLDSELMRHHPEGFLHLVPPQPSEEELRDPSGLEQYKRRILAQAPKDDGGGSLYHLVETDNYPEGDKRVHKFILVQHPFEWGYKWTDMAQIDYSRPEARAWQIAQARRLFEELGVDGIRRDMSYFEVNGRFYPHWESVLKWERDRAQEPWVRQALDDSIQGFEKRKAALGDLEFLQEMVHAIRQVKPAALIIDEVYDHHRAVSRTGSNALYNKVGLYDALLSRDVERIRGALWDTLFGQWQHGAAAWVNFPANHDAYEGNPYDKFGGQARAVLANTLMFLPSLIYNGLELGAGRQEMLIRDESVSEDDWRPEQKMIPFDARAWINWAVDPMKGKFFRMIMDVARRNRDIFLGNMGEVLEPVSGSRAITAWMMARKDPLTGAQKSLLVAANWSRDTAWSHFRLGESGLQALGAFTPRADRQYILKDWADQTPDGQPKAYTRQGSDLAAHGLEIGLPGFGVHVFEVEEVPLR